MKIIILFLSIVHCAIANLSAKSNLLFIAIDDLNDWVGCLGGHPQARTPNLDRLASSGVLFSNAHCAAPSCNPSRTAVFTGISPHRSGLYRNGQSMRQVLPDTEIIPKTFSRAGYRSIGSGKMLHYFIDQRSWDQYFPPKETENPFPRTLYPEKRPVNLPRGGPWQYVETDWGPLDSTDQEFGGDYLVSEWVGKELLKKHDKPFFLACGIYRPHEPWFVPKKYFDAFPIEKIQLPPGYREDDLNDLPAQGKRLGPNRYFAHIRKNKQWKNGVQGYLASIYFADTMLGHVLDNLEKGPNSDNTIVVLWSDHGWHLGEKQHWQKFTGWRACTRVPLIIRAPKGTASLPKGTLPGTCSEPVSLLSLAPTLLELSGLDPIKTHDGPSLVPLLADPNFNWPHVAITHLDTPGSFGISSKRWRYIKYSNGGEELYDIEGDPYEWINLANEDLHQSTLKRLRSRAPTKFAELVKPGLNTLPQLEWIALAERNMAPVSKPDGNPFEVIFVNKTDRTVELFWMTLNGERKSYRLIGSGQQFAQQTRPGAVWMISETKEDGGESLGYFKVGDRSAKALIVK
ncbi:MAG: sulfatase-like hydrolase/transferase [Verrucomicrobiota bacterium]|nr:sulfatase-like hydrolase/transferase [Verrucomicrobiota bacterium]